MPYTTTGALTVLIPVLDTENELPACLSIVAGLALIQRVTRMADKSGVTNILVVCQAEQQALADLLVGSHAQAIDYDALDQYVCMGPVLLLAPNCLPDAGFFSTLGQKQIKSEEILLWEDGQAMLLGAERGLELFREIRHPRCFSQLVQSFSKPDKNKASLSLYHAHVGLPVHDDQDRLQVETILLSGLVKATEGWIALHINRKISLAVTRRLMHTSVTPNHMTLVSMILGLAGAVFFLSAEHSMQILGALFFLAHSILDGCDGELARLKFMESRLGGMLDFWSDNVVHVTVFAAMGVGWAAASPDSFWPWLSAALAVAGTAASASLIYFHTMRAEKKTGPLYTSVSTSEHKSAVVRIADILSRRDFIYLVLVLALLGQTHWFLIMTAIGAPIYALLLIGITLRD